MDNDIIDLKRLLLILRRRLHVVVLSIATLVALAAAYIATTPSKYTAETLLFLDKSVTKAISEISTVKQMAFEKAAVESEVEVIRSKQVAKRVVEDLKNTDFFPKTTTEQERDEIFPKLARGLFVSRVGETYVLSIRYTGRSPEEAAFIANSFARAYIQEQMDALTELSKNTAAWLQTQVDALGKEVISAREESARFRQQFNQLQRGVGGETKDDLSLQHTSEVGLTKLRTLEKKAETYSDLYDSYVERLETVSMQQSYPVTETRIITEASMPKSPSHPKSFLIMGASIIFGAGLGLLLTLVIDNFDRTLKRAGQVKRSLGLSFLGFLPLRKESQADAITFTAKDGHSNQYSLHQDAVTKPASLASDTIRNIRNAVDQKNSGKPNKVIGVTSADTVEGKFIVAANLASYVAQSASCILIDGDIRNSTPTAKNSPAQTLFDLSSVLNKENRLRDAILWRAEGQLALLPSRAENIATSVLHLNATSIENLISSCSEFDYIVINLPSLTNSADLCAFSNSIDAYVVVAEWNKSVPNNLRFQIEQNHLPQDNIAGLVLENADMGQMKKFYGHNT